MIWMGGMAVVALLLVVGLVQGLRAHMALQWPSVDGKIVRKQILQPDPDADKYIRDFAYTYEVAGQSHTASRVSLTNDLTRSATQSWLSTPLVRFEVGQTVKVFYDPSQPASAYLSKADLAALRLPATLFWATLLGGILVALAAAPNRFQATLQPPDLSGFFAHLDRAQLAWAGLALTGIWLLWRLLLPLRMAALYKTVQAKVIESRVEYTRTPNNSTHGNQARYTPYVEFEYEVGGVVCHGNKLVWDNDALNWSSIKGAKNYHEGFKVGQPLAVQVNRLDPATAVVDGRLSWLHLVTPLLLAAVFGGLGWFLHNHPAKPAATADHPAASAPATDSDAAAPAATDQAEVKPGTDAGAAEKPAEAPAKTKTHGHKPAKHKRHDK
jgi:hypothetical protein